VKTHSDSNRNQCNMNFSAATKVGYWL